MDKEKISDNKIKDIKEWLKQQCFREGDLDITYLMERITSPLSQDVSADKAYFLLNQSETWQQMDRETDSLFNELYQLDCDKTDDLFNAVAAQQTMYGDACYMVGLKDGIGFMLWALGKKQAQLCGGLVI